MHYLRTFAIFCLLVLLQPALSYGQAATPSVSLSASPLTGVGSTAVTLNWTATNVQSCTASGGWSGSKALSGSEVVNISITTTFTLTCQTGEGTAVVSWTPPTQNTDGSPLTDLAGYELFISQDATNLGASSPFNIGPEFTSFEVAGLAPGTWYFGMKAVRQTLNLKSVMSNVASKVIGVQSVTDSATVQIESPPNPPIITTIEQVVYDYREHTQFGLVLWREIGTVDLGVQCNSAFQVEYGWFEVPLDQVTLSKFPKSATVVARCG